MNGEGCSDEDQDSLYIMLRIYTFLSTENDAKKSNVDVSFPMIPSCLVCGQHNRQEIKGVSRPLRRLGRRQKGAPSVPQRGASRVETGT